MLKKIEIKKFHKFIKILEGESKLINCIICFDKLKPYETTILSCNHQYHTKCIKKWIRIKNQCPICRNFLNNNDYNIFLSKCKKLTNKVLKTIEYGIIIPGYIIVFDEIILGCQSIKLTCEIPVQIINFINCGSIVKFHKKYWENFIPPFVLSRVYLKLFICNLIKNYYNIRQPIYNVIEQYNKYYNDDDNEEEYVQNMSYFFNRI